MYAYVLLQLLEIFLWCIPTGTVLALLTVGTLWIIGTVLEFQEKRMRLSE